MELQISLQMANLRLLQACTAQPVLEGAAKPLSVATRKAHALHLYSKCHDAHVASSSTGAENSTLQPLAEAAEGLLLSYVDMEADHPHAAKAAQVGVDTLRSVRPSDTNPYLIVGVLSDCLLLSLVGIRPGSSTAALSCPACTCNR